MVWNLVRMPPGRLSGEVFRASPSGRRPPGQTEDTLERLYLLGGLGMSSWECLPKPPKRYNGFISEKLVEVAGERSAWVSLLRLLPQQP